MLPMIAPISSANGTTSANAPIHDRPTAPATSRGTAPRNKDRTAIYAMNISVSMTPGITPAMNSFATEVSVNDP